MFNDQYIYLHFFDRELRNSIGQNLYFKDKTAQEVILTALLMTDIPLCVSFSNMFESLETLPFATKLVFECEKYNLVKMATSMRTFDEFISSRKSLYFFDKDRYPIYFNNAEILWPTNMYTLADDTTTILRAKIIDELEESCTFSFLPQIRDTLQLTLIKNRQNAITYSLFQKSILDIYSNNRLTNVQYQKSVIDIKQLISIQYTSRYLHLFDGTIVTGIPGFSCYDFLAKDQFASNYSLFSRILRPFFDDNFNLQTILELRLNNRIYHQFHKILQTLICNLRQITSNIDRAISVVNSYQAVTHNLRCGANIAEYIYGMHHYVCKRFGINKEVNGMKAKILIVVATPLEFDAVLARLRMIGPVVSCLGNISYYESTIGELLVYVVKCQMGSGGSGGSLLTISEAIDELTPNYIIMAGIAWGNHKKKQHIGDLLVAQRIWDYDPIRINSDNSVTPRGTISPASARLLQMFEIVCADTNKYSAHYGLVASGSNLLDNWEAVERLKAQQPELIGGDMESAGMASACSRKNVDCIMVKGICDWAHGKAYHKKENQQIAAENSADAIASLLIKLAL